MPLLTAPSGALDALLPWLASAALPPTPQASPPPIATPLATQPTQPLRWTHPEANRHIVLGGVPIDYQLQRRARKSVGMTITPYGLQVAAPVWVSISAIEAALQGKADWIVRKLAHMRDQHQQHTPAPLVWQHQAVWPWLGQQVCIYQPQLAPSADNGQHKKALLAWLKSEAGAHFTERLNHFAPQLNVRWSRLFLTQTKSRWGSANAAGHIRLHMGLMHLSPELIDYVVVHELAHLIHMNHSPAFWREVERILPDYATLRRQLRQTRLPA